MSFEQNETPGVRFGDLVGTHHYTAQDFQPGDNYEIDQARAMEAKRQQAAAYITQVHGLSFRETAYVQEPTSAPSHAA